jgi:hypothetical protein
MSMYKMSYSFFLSPSLCLSPCSFSSSLKQTQTYKCFLWKKKVWKFHDQNSCQRFPMGIIIDVYRIYRGLWHYLLLHMIRRFFVFFNFCLFWFAFNVSHNCCKVKRIKGTRRHLWWTIFFQSGNGKRCNIHLATLFHLLCCIEKRLHC